MPDTTPLLGLPYPIGTDLLMDGDEAIRDLALAIESKLGPASSPVVYPAAVGDVFEGSRLYRSGGSGTLRVALRCYDTVPPGGTLLTVPGAWRPQGGVGTSVWRVIVWRQNQNTTVPITLRNDGILYCEVALGNGDNILGMVRYPL